MYDFTFWSIQWQKVPPTCPQPDIWGQLKWLHYLLRISSLHSSVGFTLNHIIRLLDRHHSESRWRWTFILWSCCGHILTDFISTHIFDGLPSLWKVLFICWPESHHHIFARMSLWWRRHSSHFGSASMGNDINCGEKNIDRFFNQIVLAHFSSVWHVARSHWLVSNLYVCTVWAS